MATDGRHNIMARSSAYKSSIACHTEDRTLIVARNVIMTTIKYVMFSAFTFLIVGCAEQPVVIDTRLDPFMVSTAKSCALTLVDNSIDVMENTVSVEYVSVPCGEDAGCYHPDDNYIEVSEIQGRVGCAVLCHEYVHALANIVEGDADGAHSKHNFSGAWTYCDGIYL